MAVTTITPTELSWDTGAVVSQGAGTAINTSNTMAIAYPRHGRLLIFIDSDHADTSATFAVGDKLSSGIGTVVAAVGDTIMHLIVVNSDQLKDNDGNLSISWAANSAGFVRAFYLP